jgi:hypothetical protein
MKYAIFVIAVALLFLASIDIQQSKSTLPAQTGAYAVEQLNAKTLTRYQNIAALSNGSRMSLRHQSTTHSVILAQRCAEDGSPCSDPNNSSQRYPRCSQDCCSGTYHECDGVACICGSGR